MTRIVACPPPLYSGGARGGSWTTAVVSTNREKRVSHPYRMWFFGWVTGIGNADVPGCDATYFARGKDLDHWEVLCKDGTWDAGKHNEQ